MALCAVGLHQWDYYFGYLVAAEEGFFRSWSAVVQAQVRMLGFWPSAMPFFSTAIVALTWACCTAVTGCRN